MHKRGSPPVPKSQILAQNLLIFLFITCKFTQNFNHQTSRCALRPTESIRRKLKRVLTIATAKPMTVMMPKGTSIIPMPEPWITASGKVVALRWVSFVVIVTVISVVLETVTLSAAPVERKGVELAVAAGGRKLAVVLVAAAAMIGPHGCAGECV